MAIGTVVEPEFGDATTVPLEFVTVHWYVLVGVRFWELKITFMPTTAEVKLAETAGQGCVVKVNGPTQVLARLTVEHVSLRYTWYVVFGDKPVKA